MGYGMDQTLMRKRIARLPALPMGFDSQVRLAQLPSASEAAYSGSTAIGGSEPRTGGSKCTTWPAPSQKGTRSFRTRSATAARDNFDR